MESIKYKGFGISETGELSNLYYDGFIGVGKSKELNQVSHLLYVNEDIIVLTKETITKERAAKRFVEIANSLK
jgi:hypothetical protein